MISSLSKSILLPWTLLVAALFFACAPKALTDERRTVEEARKPQTIERQAWELEWENTLDEGRKEGRVVLVTTSVPAVRDALMQGFSSKTNIKLDFVVGRGGEIAAKLLTERRNGLFLADIYLGGNTTLVNSIKPAAVLAPLKPVLFLPEVLDSSLWYRNTLPWLDKDQLMLQVRMMAGGRQEDIAFMKGSIDKQEFSSYYDLLKPQLKGRMNIQDPAGAGKGGVGWVNKALTYYGLDWDYMKALAKQEPFATRDKRLQIEWVVRGKHLIAINPESAIGDEFREAGMPLDYIIFKESKDVLGGGSAVISLIDRAPHPAAAKLFMNWFLGREGQTIFSRSYSIQSARMDTPTDHLQPHQIRQPGVDYPVETEEFIMQEEKLLPKVLEIFEPLSR